MAATITVAASYATSGGTTRHGVDVNSPRALDAIAQQVGGTNTVRGYLSWLFDEVGRRADIQVARDVRPGAGANLLDTSYNAGLNSMSAGFRSMLQAIGESGEVVRFMNELGQTFRDLAAMASQKGWG